MKEGNLRIEVFLDGKRYAGRTFYSCPRVGEYVGVKIGDEDIVCLVYRVVHLRPSKDSELLGFQEIDIYVKRETADEPS